MTATANQWGIWTNRTAAGGNAGAKCVHLDDDQRIPRGEWQRVYDKSRTWEDLAGAHYDGVTVPPQTISDAGNIGTAEAFGTPQINLSITAAGAVASAEAFGTAKVNQNIAGAGAIASVEAFGTAKVNLSVAPTGITSAEAFGAPTVLIPQTVSPSSIASAEAFGTSRVNLNIVSAGAIASTEAFGTARANLSIAPSAVASAEAFGTAQINQAITAAGIASAEAFGTAKINQSIAATGIASEGAFGSPKLNLSIVGAGTISSEEAFGSPTVSATSGAQTITGAGGIFSQTFGVAAVTVGPAPAPIQAPLQQISFGGGGPTISGYWGHVQEDREIKRSRERARKSLREVAAILHPDKNQDLSPDAREHLQKHLSTLTEAYESLKALGDQSVNSLRLPAESDDNAAWRTWVHEQGLGFGIVLYEVHDPIDPLTIETESWDSIGEIDLDMSGLIHSTQPVHEQATRRGVLKYVFIGALVLAGLVWLIKTIARSELRHQLASPEPGHDTSRSRTRKAASRRRASRTSIRGSFPVAH